MLEAITAAVTEALADAKRAKKAAAPVVAAKVFDLLKNEGAPAESPASEPGSALATVPSGLADVYAEAFEAGKNYALKCAFEGVVDQPANPYEGA